MAEERIDGTGRTWAVRRRWVARFRGRSPWERLTGRVRRMAKETVRSTGEGAGAADAEWGWVLIVFAVAIVAVIVVLPLFLALVEVVALLVVAGVALLARILLRRPWVVEARAGDGEVLRWRVVGWRASGAKVLEVADDLAAGVVPPDAERV